MIESSKALFGYDDWALARLLSHVTYEETAATTSVLNSHDKPTARFQERVKEKKQALTCSVHHPCSFQWSHFSIRLVAGFPWTCFLYCFCPCITVSECSMAGRPMNEGPLCIDSVWKYADHRLSSIVIINVGLPKWEHRGSSGSYEARRFQRLIRADHRLQRFVPCERISYEVNESLVKLSKVSYVASSVC